MKNSTTENKAIAAITAQVDPASTWFDEAAKCNDTAPKVLADFAKGQKTSHGAARRMALIIIKLNAHNLETKKEIGQAVFGKDYKAKKSAENPAASLISNATDILAREHVRTVQPKTRGAKLQAEINKDVDTAPAIEAKTAASHNMLPFDPDSKQSIKDWLQALSDIHPKAYIEICRQLDA